MTVWRRGVVLTVFASLMAGTAAMGPLHEAAYFAESIISPSAVIEKGKGYEGPDGSSKMPSFNDSMTVQEAIDLVAYLRSLKPTTAAPAGHRGH